jgi:hypothetical protein
MSVQDQPRSPSPERAQAYEIAGLGFALSAAGLYFMLGAGGLLPLPEANGPTFIVFLAGAAFLFAGLTCMTRVKAGMDDRQTDVPENAGIWLKLVYRALGIGAARALLRSRVRSARYRPPVRRSAASCSASARLSSGST